jgi:hypothetical protein
LSIGIVDEMSSTASAAIAILEDFREVLTGAGIGRLKIAVRRSSF